MEEIPRQNCGRKDEKKLDLGPEKSKNEDHSSLFKEFGLLGENSTMVETRDFQSRNPLHIVANSTI